MLIHPFNPVYNTESRILILGTFPSVASRAEQFYYGHPKNRFWKVLSELTGNSLPETVEEKKALLFKKRIALWDVLKSCDIELSKDSSIMNPVVNDFDDILKETSVQAIFTNGKKAEELYKRLCFPKTHVKSRCLPSTSPANASWSYERLLQAWSTILHYIKEQG
ncbi:MAG TPA: DNA-deoxyinosine glycosylase [Ruminiclostridium sp.]|jgi:hypoxanthine-DNA glycosylase|nr:DNA-deoxyinosine glycosylase [Ruminiclostridium sp.]